MIFEEKKALLRKVLEERGRVAFALSGGMDSSVLLAFAVDILGAESCLALTAHTPYMMEEELRASEHLAGGLGVRHITVRKGIAESIVMNPPERCYLCKYALFGEFLTLIREEGFEHLADGTNHDDLSDYRPGRRALEELGILSPFREASFTKRDIAELGRSLGLPEHVTERPAYACLLTRLEHGHPISVEMLKRVDEAETFLRGLGFRACRVRVHGDCARIELPPVYIEEIFTRGYREEIDAKLKSLGFAHVALDMAGYARGSMNVKSHSSEES